MNKLIVIAPLAFVGLLAHQAAACDLNRQASIPPAAVADCSGSNCNTETQNPPATQQREKTAEIKKPAAFDVAVEGSAVAAPPR
jgi:hypothetical protein